MTPTQAVHFLLDRQMSEQDIANRAGLSQKTVNRIRHGRRCLHENGEAIVALAQAEQSASAVPAHVVIGEGI